MRPMSIWLLTVAGLCLTAIGIVSPIVWDLYKGHSALELRLLSTSLVVSSSDSIKKLQFTYDGERVDSVSRLVFQLKNTGRTPIKAADVVASPAIKFNGARVLEVNLIDRVPENLDVQLILPGERDSVSFLFPLLNPSDSAKASLLVATDKPAFASTARIAGISKLDYAEESTSSGRKGRLASWQFVVSAVSTVLSFLLFLGGLVILGTESGIDEATRNGLIQVPSFANAGAVNEFLKKIPSVKTTEIKGIAAAADKLRSDMPLSPKEQDTFRKDIVKALSDLSGSRVITVMFLIIAMTGLAYIFNSFL